MSKAFTKEDDDGGFTTPPSAGLIGVPAGHFRLTHTGARMAREHGDARVHEALLRAETLPRVGPAPSRATLGVTVVVEGANGETRRYRLVSPEERALVGDGCSVDGPVGKALLGAEVGDVRDVVLPRGAEELAILALEGE